MSIFGWNTLLTQIHEVPQEQLAAKATFLLEQSILAEDFVGVSAGIAQGDEILWQGGAGFLNLAARKPANEDMIHRIASITKPMTAVAILQLVAAGKLDLDVPIQTYLPDFPEKRKGAFTIRQLLSHTAGVKAYQSRAEFTSLVYYPTLTAAMDVFKQRKLAFEPGTGFQYTTYGYTILGAIIEEVTGQSYAAYMHENVWGPAGMTSTDIELSGEDHPNKARLYTRNHKGEFSKDIRDNLSVKYAGGGVESTVTDLLRFGQAILDNKLISSEMLEMMRATPEVPRNGRTPYGLGWYVVDHEKYGRIIRHGGAQSGTSTYLAIYLDHDLVVATISNTANASNEVTSMNFQLGRFMMNENELDEEISEIAILPTQVLDRFVGTYEFEGGEEVSIYRRDDKLWSKAKGYPDIRVYPASEKELFYRIVDIHYHFQYDEMGNITDITHFFQGVESHPKKVK